MRSTTTDKLGVLWEISCLCRNLRNEPIIAPARIWNHTATHSFFVPLAHKHTHAHTHTELCIYNRCKDTHIIRLAWDWIRLSEGVQWSSSAPVPEQELPAKIEKAVLRFYILSTISVLLWHPTKCACDKREASTCQRRVWSLHNVMPLITALRHSALYCQTWFPVYRDFTWQKYILPTAAAAAAAAAQEKKKKKISVSYFNI